MHFFVFLLVSWLNLASATTIAIIDTGFDLDHDFLKPKILTEEVNLSPSLKEFHGWNFHDNSHLKEPVIKDQSLLQEILLYRNLRAKGHKEGLLPSEFEWFKKKSADKEFQDKVKIFKRHSHGTFVAGIALREGENIQLFPIRGLHIPSPVIAVNESTANEKVSLKGKNPDEKFHEEIKNSEDRVIKKFSKICRYLSINKIDIVNASYGITFKSINSKFREKFKEITGKEIEEQRLQNIVKEYFTNIENRTSKIILKYPRMLFIFSAGNSGINNDEFPHYPSKVRLPNTISVGAINGEFLASFSNYGVKHVDIGAPGVAILSLVPKVYSHDGHDLYSPSSGTSMAAPYVSNLAAQILNTNESLRPQDVKRIIMETGDEKEHLKSKLISGSIVNNHKAIKAALLSRDLNLNQAINLAKTGLIPIEDSISIGQPQAIGADALEKKVFDTFPKEITPQEIDEIQSTNEEFLQPSDLKINKPDNSNRPPSVVPSAQKSDADQAPSSQNGEQSPQPSEGQTPSSSQSESQPHQTLDLGTEPSSP
jgi:hypothetical protein